jgi:hypothetical protein
MIRERLMAFFHITSPAAAADQELARLLRRAKAASFQHQRITSNIKTDSLDRIKQHVNDPRPEEIRRSVDSLNLTMRDMLNETVRKMG